MTNKKSSLIVGAGIAGLLAATHLKENGFEVTVVDKGRGVGGRMASRRLNPGRADHGAQFFTVRSPIFQDYVNKWLDQKIVVEWTRGFGSGDGHPRYRGAPAMTAVAKHLAQSLTVHKATRLTKISWADNHWVAQTAEGQSFSAAALLLTAPIPQSLTLLSAGGVYLPEQAMRALKRIKYDPCFAVMARLTQPSTIPAPGAVQVRSEPIAWIADNQQKGISDKPTVTIHAGPHFTRQHLDEDRSKVGRLLLEEAAAQNWLDLSAVDTVQVHRWLYAQPAVLHPERTLFVNSPGPLAFAGDAFLESRVEGAALSGLAAAEKLLQVNDSF